MFQKTSYSQNQLRDYSSVFSRSAALAFLKDDLSLLDYKIDRYDKSWRKKKSATYLHYIKHLYKIIEANYQNEYIYKNSILNNWLLKELGETDSKIFSEYRVGNAIADLVIFNGRSKAFEIKSELDSGKRLNLQLENYRKAFNEIYLVIPELKWVSYSHYDDSVGIITFDRNDEFSIKRKAQLNETVCADTIMHILRTSEYKAIVKSYFGDLPKMTSFTMFDICFRLIRDIPSKELSRLFIAQMKKRPLYSKLSPKIHKELNQLNLALNLTEEKKRKLIENLQKPIET